MSEERPEERRRLVRRIVGLFSAYRGRTALILVSIVVTSALGIVNPLLIQVVFDDALFVEGGPKLDLLYALVGIMVAIPLVLGALGVAQTYLTNWVGNRVMQDLRDRLYAHLQSMPLAFFTGTRTGEIQSRLANDVGGVQTVVTSTASSILSNVVTVASSLVAMLILSWELTLVSLVLVPVFVFLTWRVGRARRAVTARTQESMAEMSAITQETLSVSGILLAKVFERRADEIERYRRANERLAGLQVRQQMTGQGFFGLVQAFFGITPAIVYLVAGVTLASGSGPQISAGTIVAFTALQTRLFFPIISLLRVSVEIQSSLALFERVFEYLDLKAEIVDAPDAVTLDPESVRGEVALDDVSFFYPASSPLAEAAGAERRERGRHRPAGPAKGARPPLARHRAGPAGRAGGPQRRREDHGLLPDSPPLRRERGSRGDRRPRRPQGPAGLAVGDGGRGHPGDLPLPLERARQPALRQARRHPGGAGGCGPLGADPRPHRGAGRGLRHHGGRARLPPVGRREAARGDRPRRSSRTRAS